ncbi:hypothetical protein GWE18_00435 [Bradyrhizobium sp. CSA112]|nr:hypothetical protein [Bradyrhizobium sp. CSA112]MDE5451343.1 hypothetical protein [Bradyrhizobium sp. CSA112]
MFVFGSVLGFVAGGALIWFCREPVTVWYKGAENYVGALNDKINAIKAKL